MPATLDHPRQCRSTYSHKCGATGKLPSTLALNVHKDPKHYATFFCTGCQTYRPIAEFKWMDGTQVGT